MVDKKLEKSYKELVLLKQRYTNFLRIGQIGLRNIVVVGFIIPYKITNIHTITQDISSSRQ